MPVQRASSGLHSLTLSGFEFVYKTDIHVYDKSLCHGTRNLLRYARRNGPRYSTVPIGTLLISRIRTFRV